MNSLLAITRKFAPTVLIAGAGILVLAFFLPWWGIRVEIPAEPSGKATDSDYKDRMADFSRDIRKHARVSRKDARWHEDMEIEWVIDDYRLGEEFQRGEKFRESGRLWGWNTSAGITAFIFGLLLLPVGIVPIFVIFLRRWSWIGAFVAGLLGLITLILGMVFYFGSPWKNTDFIAQGVGLSPGPFLVILGSSALFAAGVAGGVFGLMNFIGETKGQDRPREIAEPDPQEPDEPDIVEPDFEAI